MPIPSVADWEDSARDFWSLWQYPNCVGSIDGKHCVLDCPPGTGSEYFNYKRSFSVVLLAVCDARYKFKVIDVGAPGRMSDGGVFQAAEFGKRLLSGTLAFPGSKPLPGETRSCHM